MLERAQPKPLLVPYVFCLDRFFRHHLLEHLMDRSIMLSFVAEWGAHRGSLPAYFNVLDNEPQTADQKNQD